MDYKKILMDKYLEAFDKNKGLESKKVEKRFEHTLGVVKAMHKINDFYNLDLDKNMLDTIGYLHDYAKYADLEEYEEAIKEYNPDNKRYLKESSNIWHALLGDLIIRKDLHINDDVVLNAIKYHSTGNDNLSIYGEVLMAADFTEDGRDGDMFETARHYLYESSNIEGLYKTLAYILRMKTRKTNLGGYPLIEESRRAYNKYKIYLESPLEKVKSILRLINHNIAYDIKLYDVKDSSPISDYVIVCTVSNARNMDACISYIRSEFDIRNTEKGEYWTLIDMDDVILHLFLKEERASYNLDAMYTKEITIEG